MFAKPLRATRSAKLAALVLAALALFPAVANADIYWTNDASTIGRANLDGTNANQSFISGASFPAGIAVDAGHIYWTNDDENDNNGTIGRANLDGSGVNQSFISGASLPKGVAVDAGYIYWTNIADGTIGRANLDGTGVKQSFIITGASFSFGIAVDAGHIYWTNQGGGTIGRANLNGTNVNQSFIIGVTPASLAVDGGHVYWGNGSGGPGTDTIGRADLDGSNVNTSLISGANLPYGIAVDAEHIYWGNLRAVGTIGRANLDGGGVNQVFISAYDNSPYGIAVDHTPSADPSPASLGFGSPKPVSVGKLSAPQSLTYTNNGNEPLIISGFDLSGTDADEFSASKDTCHGAVAPGASCSVEVRFAPVEVGSASATLTAQTNAPSDPTTRLRGKAADTDPPDTSILSAPLGRSHDRTPTFRFHSDERGSTFLCRLDQKPFHACPATKTFTVRPGQRHVVTVKAKDAAGNVDRTPAKRSFTVLR